MRKFDGLLWMLGAAQTLGAAPLLWRAKKRWHCGFDSARFFGPSLQAPRGVRVVMVGLGFAESRWALELGRQIHIARPDVEMVWAIFDADSITGAGTGAGVLPMGQKMVPPPFDYAPAVSFWLRRVRPDAVVFLEKFQYANFARVAHNRGVRVAAVAARLRDHRSGRYKWGDFYARWLLSAFDFIGLRSAQEKAHLGNLSDAPNVRVTGSLKFWPKLPEIEAGKLEDLQAWLSLAQNRPVFAAGSTQPGDENWVLEAFAPLREEFGAVLLLAPRHAERGDEVEALCQVRGWKVARRSRGQEIENADVLLLDTIGELTHAYGAARGAFVGGTIVGTGHNVLEPVAHGIPVFFGPKRGTFAVEQEMCEAASVGFRVQTPAELESGWRRAVEDENWRSEVALNAAQLNAHGARAWQETVAALLELLEETRR